MSDILIVWGGNMDLAELVADKLSEKGFDAQKGGDARAYHRYLGMQIIEQMKYCRYAVILIQKSDQGKLRDNLVYEWGYLEKRLDKGNILICLIDTDKEDLPDGATKLIEKNGTHIVTHKSEDMQTDEMANQIVKNFQEKIDFQTNKTGILSKWHQISSDFNAISKFTNKQKFEYTLFSSIAAYYSVEANEMLIAVNNINSNNIDCIKNAKHLTTAYLNLLIATDYFTKNLTKRSYNEIRDILRNVKEKNNPDTEEDKWIEIRRNDLKCLLAWRYAQVLSGDQALKIYSEAIAAGNKVIDLIKKSGFENDDNNKDYALLLKAYAYRNVELAYNALSREYLNRSYEARKEFSNHYRKSYPYDLILNDKFEQEYYLSLIEYATSVSDKDERNRIIDEVKIYTDRWSKTDMQRKNVINKIEQELRKMKCIKS